MKVITYYCDYCGREITSDNHSVIPCQDCAELLRSALKERRDYNRMNYVTELVLLVPNNMKFTIPSLDGSLRPVFQALEDFQVIADREESERVPKPPVISYGKHLCRCGMRFPNRKLLNNHRTTQKHWIL